MYLAGFGNHHQTEALEGALPKSQNSPQKSSLGLYSEQLSGSAFTSTRSQNLHSWLYRILPSVVHKDYEPYNKILNFLSTETQAPNPYRWLSFPQITQKKSFVDGLFYFASSGLISTYIYQCNKSMQNSYFCSYDGELLFVPYKGELELCTEFGKLVVRVGQIALIPRAVMFTVKLNSKEAEGYLCENGAKPLTLPNLGFMGANALANPRHFLYPIASYEDRSQEVKLICKYQKNLWITTSDHSPLNVVAWHGNYAPFLYDLSLFNTINTVSFDHPDPSIFTVLTSESSSPGLANLDFVIFPPRWMVAEHSFRPPYFHRNLLSEFMGLIYGHYDAKTEGFVPGGVSIHNSFTPHGPDRQSYELMSAIELKPTYYANTLAFMFECKNPWILSQEALDHPSRQENYSECWQNLHKNF